MASITLVGTTHNERGACTEDALLNILRSIEPDVVFLEMRASDLLTFGMQILEVRAVRRYAKLQRTKEVAVDEFETPNHFRSDVDELFAYVERNSEEFNELEFQRHEAASLSFATLNSKEFEVLSDKCDKALERAVNLSRNKELVTRHSTWTSLHSQREQSMLSNIYNYCRRKPDSRGAFLVGAAHLSSLARGIDDLRARQLGIIHWEAWNRPDRFC